MAKRDTTAIFIDIEDLDIHVLPLTDHIAWMAHLFGPRQVADVHQPVDTRFDFDKDAEVGDVAHCACKHGTCWIAVADAVPRIGLQLLHTQRDLLVLLVNIEDFDLHKLPQRNHLAGMIDMARPRHFADMNQPFNTFLQFDKRSVIGNRNDLTFDRFVFIVLLADVVPRMRLQLLEAKRDALALFFVVEHHDLDFLVEIDNFAGVRYAAPRQIGNVQQAVYTAQVDKDPKVDDVFDRSLQHLANFELLQNLLALLFELLLDEFAVRYHDVLVGGVQLHNSELHALLQIRVEVAYRAHIDLRTWQECFEAIEELHDHTAFDTADDGSFDNFFFLVDLFNALPAADFIGFLFGKHELAIAIFFAVEVHLYRITTLQGIAEFVARHNPVALVPNVDYNMVFADLEHTPFYDVLLPHIDAGTIDQGPELVVDRIGSLAALVFGQVVFTDRTPHHFSSEALLFFSALQALNRDRQIGVVNRSGIKVKVVAGWDANIIRCRRNGFSKQPVNIFGRRIALFNSSFSAFIGLRYIIRGCRGGGLLVSRHRFSRRIRIRRVASRRLVGFCTCIIRSRCLGSRCLVGNFLGRGFFIWRRSLCRNGFGRFFRRGWSFGGGCLFFLFGHICDERGVGARRSYLARTVALP